MGLLRRLPVLLLLLWRAAGQGTGGVATAPVLPVPTVLMCGLVPALEVLFDLNGGAEIVGALTQVLATLQSALCPTSVDGYLTDCDAFEVQHRALYQSFGAQLCGFPDGAWNSTALGVNMQAMTPDQALEYLLAQCPSVFTGNLTTIALAAVAQFTSVSTQSRSDVAAVIAANLAAKGINSSQAVDLSTLYPSVLPPLAPIPASARQPAVLTAGYPADPAEFVPSNPGLVTFPLQGVKAEYQAAALATANPVFPALSHPDETVQYPGALAAVALASDAGTSIYKSLYLAHPSPAARFQTSYCSTRPWNDETCFPVVTPQIGVTHDMYGNRLESDRGQPVPPNTPDVAGVPQPQAVPPGAFSAPTLYTGS